MTTSGGRSRADHIKWLKWDIAKRSVPLWRTNLSKTLISVPTHDLKPINLKEWPSYQPLTPRPCKVQNLSALDVIKKMNFTTQWEQYRYSPCSPVDDKEKLGADIKCSLNKSYDAPHCPTAMKRNELTVQGVNQVATIQWNKSQNGVYGETSFIT